MAARASEDRLVSLELQVSELAARLSRLESSLG